MAESSSAETTTSSHFSGSSHSTNFNAYTSEVESDSEANSSEAGLSSRVVSCCGSSEVSHIMWNNDIFERIIGLNLKNYRNTF